MSSNQTDMKTLLAFEAGVEHATTRTCGGCKFWSFKVGSDLNFGACLNPKVLQAMRISTSKCDFGEGHREAAREVSTYAEVQFEENTFGCIHFEEAQPYA